MLRVGISPSGAEWFSDDDLLDSAPLYIRAQGKLLPKPQYVPSGGNGSLTVVVEPRGATNCVQAESAASGVVATGYLSWVWDNDLINSTLSGLQPPVGSNNGVLTVPLSAPPIPR